jgi:hypothetical protein
MQLLFYEVSKRIERIFDLILLVQVFELEVLFSLSL